MPVYLLCVYSLTCLLAKGVIVCVCVCGSMCAHIYMNVCAYAFNVWLGRSLWWTLPWAIGFLQAEFGSVLCSGVNGIDPGGVSNQL